MSDQTEAPIGVSEAADEAVQPKHERQGGRARRRGKRRGQARRRSGARRKQKEPATGEPQAVGDLALALAEARQDGVEISGEATSGEAASGDGAQSEAMLSQLREFEGGLVEAGGELERIKRKMDAARQTPEKSRRGRRRLGRPDGLARDRMPDGAILVAARMAREGRPQEEVRTFLRESFSGIDSSGVVKLAFSDEAVSD